MTSHSAAKRCCSTFRHVRGSIGSSRLQRGEKRERFIGYKSRRLHFILLVLSFFSDSNRIGLINLIDLRIAYVSGRERDRFDIAI